MNHTRADLLCERASKILNPGGVNYMYVCVILMLPKAVSVLYVCVLQFKLLIPAALTHKSCTPHFLDFFPPYLSLFDSFLHFRITAAVLCLRVDILASASLV